MGGPRGRGAGRLAAQERVQDAKASGFSRQPRDPEFNMTARMLGRWPLTEVSQHHRRSSGGGRDPSWGSRHPPSLPGPRPATLRIPHARTPETLGKGRPSWGHSYTPTPSSQLAAGVAAFPSQVHALGVLCPMSCSPALPATGQAAAPPTSAAPARAQEEQTRAGA